MTVTHIMTYKGDLRRWMKHHWLSVKHGSASTCTTQNKNQMDTAQSRVEAEGSRSSDSDSSDDESASSGIASEDSGRPAAKNKVRKPVTIPQKPTSGLLQSGSNSSSKMPAKFESSDF